MLCYVLILWFCFGSNKMHLSPPGKIPLQHRSPPCPANPVPPLECLKQSSSEHAKGRQQAEGAVTHHLSNICDSGERMESYRLTAQEV